MINFNEVKVGDYLMVENDGSVKRGVVTRLNGDEKQACVDNGVQEFWYETNQLLPLPITQGELENLQFDSVTREDGNVKYSKGAFRMLIPAENDFSKYELWYRDERRSIDHALSVHELQNHFYEMTKVHLDDTKFD